MRKPLLLLTLVLSACGKEEATPTKPAAAYSDLSGSLEEAQSEAVSLLGENGSRARAVWDQIPEGKAWTDATLAALTTRRPTLERSRDLEDFCPGYARATNFQKETCWLRIVSAMAKYESNFRPTATYLEASGQTSVGLLMMNPRHCPAAPTVEMLKQAEPNIRCAAARFERLVNRDLAISGENNSGGAAYWSVLRMPYRSGNLFLGRKPHIQLFTRSYRAFQE